MSRQADALKSVSFGGNAAELVIVNWQSLLFCCPAKYFSVLQQDDRVAQPDQTFR